ncbi:MAG TPA: Wadjet anti-phage system protein JetD domain-containing protein, partial [Cytophagales bacterium]
AFPKTRSFLMDTETFRAFKKYTVKGADFYRTSLPHLTPEETHLFYHLLRLEDHNRLEQERIPQAFVVQRLHEVLAEE